MSDAADLASEARGILDSNLYMVLGTANEDGRPWVTPVYYAVESYTEFYWVSSPEREHSRNVAAQPEVSIVVFDSRAPIGTGQGVYMTAHAEELAGAELERGIDVFSQRSQAHGAAREWTLDDVRPPAPYRLYRATASEHSVLDPEGSPDQRIPVQLA
jgi:uncharacterized protein YhbP (UPF0306 family)